MKRLGILLVSSAVLFAQDFSSMRLLDGMNQVQKNIELAKKAEADHKDPYHFEKARACRHVASILASHMDDAGSRLFMVKSFNAISKAMSGKVELDSIHFITQTGVREGEGSAKRGEHEESLRLDMDSLNSKLKYTREHRALSCAPAELARAEVYYEALAYELSKPQPDTIRVVDFYKKSKMEVNTAIQKVNMAKEGNLECYTGKPFLPQLARAESESPQKGEAYALQPLQTSTPQGEPLMVTARVHFDFDKHSIKREYIPVLNEVVKTLRDNPGMRVRIEGFTDSTGSKAYNDRLALRRAQAVRDYLTRAGIPAERIEIAGFGKERYIADNATPTGRLTNRRAEFIVIQVPAQ